jgi:tRNA threonylcarbamoyladenosine biosynthesis protein TsaB
LITLAFDTATPAPTLAVLEGAEPLALADPPPERGAGRRVAEEIHLLLRGAGLTIGDVDRIVVGIGPGGFTGLRIGIATALALGQARGIAVTGVSTLEALALGAADEAGPGAFVAPMIDARRREVFTGLYRVDPAGMPEEIMAPRAVPAQDAAAMLMRSAPPGAAVQVAGDGRDAVAGADPVRLLVVPEGAPANRVRAVDLARREAYGGARPVAPIYLRLPDAEVNRLARAAAGAPG